jgi:hypothetical protein
MFPVISDVVDVDLVFGFAVQLSDQSIQHQIVSDRESAQVKKHVMVRAQAQQITVRARPVVWCSERMDTGGFRVRPGWPFKSDAAYLARIIVKR